MCQINDLAPPPKVTSDRRAKREEKHTRHVVVRRVDLDWVR